jgi:hypothetical protein
MCQKWVTVGSSCPILNDKSRMVMDVRCRSRVTLMLNWADVVEEGVGEWCVEGSGRVQVKCQVRNNAAS